MKIVPIFVPIFQMSLPCKHLTICEFDVLNAGPDIQTVPANFMRTPLVNNE